MALLGTPFGSTAPRPTGAPSAAPAAPGLGGGMDFRKMMMAQAIGNALSALANGGRSAGGGGGMNMASMMRMQMAMQAHQAEQAKLARQQAALSSYFGSEAGQKLSPEQRALFEAYPAKATSAIIGDQFRAPSRSIKKVQQPDGSYRWQQVTGTEEDLFEAPPPGNTAKPKYMPIAGGLQQMHDWDETAQQWVKQPGSKPIARWKPGSGEGNLSVANQRTNTETLRARQTLDQMFQGKSFDEIVASQQLTDIAGLDNPSGRHLSGLVRDATRPLYGGDPELQRYIDRYLTGTSQPTQPVAGKGGSTEATAPVETEGGGFLEGASDAVKNAWQSIFPGTTPAEAGLEEQGEPGLAPAPAPMSDEDLGLAVKNFELLSAEKKAQVRAEMARRKAARGQ